MYPILSPVPLKLPSIDAFYRMFEQGNNFINASVEKASLEHQQRMVNYLKIHGNFDTDNYITDGYFYDKFYIDAEDNNMLIDLKKKTNIYG